MIRKLREWLQNKVFYTAWLLLHIVYQLQLELRDYVSFNLKYMKSRLFSCFPLYSHEGEIASFVKSVEKIPKVPKHIAISVIPESSESVLSTLIQKISPFNSDVKSSEDKNKVKNAEEFCTSDKKKTGKQVEDEINLQALARVVAWASLANIPVVSLYDYHGILKLRFKELGCYIQEELHQDFWAVKHCRDATEPPTIKFHNVHSNKSNGYVNGINGSKVHQILNIFVYSRNDGKPALVKAAKEMCADKLKSSSSLPYRAKNTNMEMEDENRSEKNGNSLHARMVPLCTNNKTEKVDESTLDIYLNRCNGWPSSLTVEAKTDPDLLVILGNIKSTLGFLPWHIRLSEIHWLPALRRVEISDFLGSLHKYSRCQQRFGT